MAKALESWKSKWKERKEDYHASNCYLIAYPKDPDKYCTCNVIFPD